MRSSHKRYPLLNPFDPFEPLLTCGYVRDNPFDNPFEPLRSLHYPYS